MWKYFEIFCVNITKYMLAHIYIYIYLKRAQTDDHKKRKKKKNQWSDEQYILNKPKSTIVFTYSHNKCYNIFTKHLFLIVVGHSLIIYYFILTYKKL